MKSVWVIISLVTLIKGETCQVQKSVFDDAKESTRIKCSSEERKVTDGKLYFDSGTVCVFTCKYNTYRYKFRCNRNEQWDEVPKNACPTKAQCQTCDGYFYDEQNAHADLKCIERDRNEEVFLLNCHLGAVSHL